MSCIGRWVFFNTEPPGKPVVQFACLKEGGNEGMGWWEDLIHDILIIRTGTGTQATWLLPEGYALPVMDPERLRAWALAHFLGMGSCPQQVNCLQQVT